MRYISYRDRIISDHQIMLGKPVIKGTRITVELLLRKMSQGAKTQDLLQMYPHLEEQDIRATIACFENITSLFTFAP